MKNSKTVFVSYARADKSIVEPFVAKINEKLNIQCWLDKHDIESGSEFEKRIKFAIDNAKVVLFFHSENSLLSEWTYREMMYAKEQEDTFIVPVIIQGNDMRGWFKVEFGSKDAININNEENVSKLFNDLRKWIGKPETHVWAGKTISVKLPNKKRICEDKLMDTLAACIKEAGIQEVHELHLKPNKFDLVHLIDNPNLSLLPVKAGRKTMFVQNLQAKNITDMLKQISESLDLGWTIYSHCVEEEEPPIDILRDIREAQFKHRDSSEMNALRVGADHYLYGDKPNIEMGLECLKALAAQDDAEAWNHLGLIYGNENYEDHDIRIAIQCYQYAMELGFSNGAINLAYLYLWGNGVDCDSDKAIELLEKAEELGNCSDEDLGLAYFDIAIVSEEEGDSFVIENICKAAKFGCKIAQEYLDAYNDYCKGQHSKSFVLEIENIVTTDEGECVVCGEIQQGYITPFDSVRIRHKDKILERKIGGVWRNGVLIDDALPGMYIGLELRESRITQFAVGDLVVLGDFPETE